MNDFLYMYKYECEERLNILKNLRKREQLQKIVDKEHPLFQLFESFYKNHEERMKILFGNVEIPKNYDQYNELVDWDTFEYVVFLPLCNFQRLIPGKFQPPAHNEEGPDKFVPNYDDYDVLEIHKKTKIHEYRPKLKEKLNLIGRSILKLSPGINSKLRKRAQKKGFKFNYEDATDLICGSRTDSFGNYLYPGYDIIINRVNICYKEARGNKTKINWAAWIPGERRNENLRICSVLDAGYVNDAIKSVIKKIPSEESDIKTIIIKDKDKETKLGGVSTIKNVFLNDAKSEVEEVKKLRFIKYPDGKPKNNQNFIRVASTINGRPLQYSKESSIFFVKSVPATDFEMGLLSQCNSIAHQIYLQTKLKLVQKYGHDIAHSIIGDYIPFTSCLWSWRPGTVAGYGLHQDSTALSSDDVKTFHYQEIVVTIIFHFGIVNADEKGADLIISLTNKETGNTTVRTYHNFIHTQLFGNQENLWHRASATSEKAATSRLVMTARRTSTGDKSPKQVMEGELTRIFGEDTPNFKLRQIEQSNDTLTLQQILTLFDEDTLHLFGKVISPSSLIGGIMNRSINPNRKASKPQSKKKSVQSRGKGDSTGIELDSENNNACTTQTAAASTAIESTTMESSSDRIDYYNITSTREEHNCDKVQTFINHQLFSEHFLLSSNALQILFDQKFCIETSVQDQKGYRKNILWSPMFREDGSSYKIGDMIPLTTYKSYHNILESDYGGGYICSNYVGTCTGICLLHPERTASYDKIVDTAEKKKSEPFKFYGSGGSSKVKGSYVSSISAVTCGAGGSLPSAQKLNATNKCLMELCRMARPLHLATKLRQKENNIDMVIYLGMFTIVEIDYGVHEHGTTFQRERCDNFHGASFLHEKSFLFHAVPFTVNYQSVATDWDVYGIDERSIPLSFGCLIDQTANKALKIDSEFMRNDILFKLMRKEKKFVGGVFTDTYKLASKVDLKKLKECVISKKVEFDNGESDDESDSDNESEEDDAMEE
ncbi:predicted protein [Chaetoceros tenuissimus]|uniref:Uncharacterized protein n=1 Tax=Chaetoceros tenuissimus TaxID=426638 RepID=A0AAD3H8N6_9STRA|nr:predicted protein [Chaetoceros tenuissimus]